MKTRNLILVGAAVSILPVLAHAGPVRTATGSFGGYTWQATSTIVGQTSTATIAGGGDPRYQPEYPKHSGVAALIMNFEGGSFICSGSLMNDRRSIVTAAHCVAPGGAGALLSTQAYFYGGPDGDAIVPFNPAASMREVSNVFIKPGYTGDVIDQNDIAVLRLAEAAPDFATSYGLYTGDDLTGLEFEVAGYGRRSDAGGAIGANLGTGRLRQGENRFDFRLGDADFLGGWSLILGEPGSQIEYSYLSDFDNGNPANDASCLVAGDPFFGGLGGPKYCDTGVGADEVGVAGGDSGGPQFIDGLLAAVTSYGLTFGDPAYGDVDPFLNSSWGEFSGFVPVWLHLDFINSLLVKDVPEPAALSLLGLGLFGAGALRRRRKA